VVTTGGFGKRTPLSEYPTRGRHTQGVLTLDVSRLDEVGMIADARVVQDGHEIAVMSDLGITMRTTTDSISRYGRATRGVRIIRLDEGHQVASFAYLAAAPEGPEPGEGEELDESGLPVAAGEAAVVDDGYDSDGDAGASGPTQGSFDDYEDEEPGEGDEPEDEE
jgi:DNA gyrase subunit A